MDQEQFKRLDRLVGRWVTDATHPAFPGVVVHGSVDVDWLEGKRFLIHRLRTDHPDFPDSISIIGNMAHAEGGDAKKASSEDAKLSMHYFDSRGVFRAYESSVDDAAWRIQREDPDFPQRFTGTLSPDGNTLTGTWQLRENGAWRDDLVISYRRQG